MGFFQDVVSIFKKRELALIESYKESEDVYTFLFEKENDLTWKAGQHGLFTITHKKVKNATKPFTVASIPTENIVKVTTKISESPSEFKKALLELEPGMTISMSGPVGPFHLQDNNPTLLIAGGIGITPFRSMLKQIETEGSAVGKQIHLLYMDSSKSFIYKDELDEIANKNSVNITYLDSRNNLQQEIEKFITLQGNNGKYFVAGPQSMVNSISDDLQNKSISKKNIKKDGFYGY